MHRIFAAIFLVLVMLAPARAEEPAPLANSLDIPLVSAVTGAAGDCLTTSAGIWLELATEANPLFSWAGPYAPVLVCAVKVPLIRYANNLPEPQRTNALSFQGAAWNGVAAWNIVGLVAGTGPGVIAAALTALISWEVTRMDRECAVFRAFISSSPYYQDLKTVECGGKTYSTKD